MYAVIKTGGKQYRVAADDVLKIEKVSGEVGEVISFGDVLMVGGDSPTVGTPMVDGASVAAEVLDQGRARKIIVFKKKRRQNYRRKKGHRQEQTTIRITDISMGGKSLASGSVSAGSAKPAPKDSADLPKLFDAPDGPADDLTKISGVGPVIVEKLNKMGITQFSQVAGLSDDEIETIDGALNFKGRIAREDWIGQAKELTNGDDA
ncbi:MAG: 50S ribosomal protein L21 [Pseudomonadota bacterium]